MSIIRKIKTAIAYSPLFKAYADILIRQTEQDRFMVDARRRLVAEGHPELLEAYAADMKRYMVDFDEWSSMYCFRDLTPEQKDEFISRSEAQRHYRRIIRHSWRGEFHDKERFLRKWSAFVHRSWLRVTPATPLEEIVSAVSGRTCIVKPVSGSLGNGVYKVSPRTPEEAEAEATKILGTDSLIEECIQGCQELQRFHPESLNTIRVVTVRGRSGIRVLGSFIRFGRGGAVVDNAHAGGIFAHIDITDGTVDSDATNTDGERFSVHPDTGLAIKGTRIPQWDTITERCVSAHALCDNFVVGWDVTVNSRGEVEFIEGNHAPDVDVMQGPLKKGIRRDFIQAVREFRKR